MVFVKVILGTKLAQMSEMVGRKGHVFAFEHRPARLETLRNNLVRYACSSGWLG